MVQSTGAFALDTGEGEDEKLLEEILTRLRTERTSAVSGRNGGILMPA